MTEDRLYLICTTCGSCCLLTGPAARAIADRPPSCPGCTHEMTVSDAPTPVTLRQAS